MPNNQYQFNCAISVDELYVLIKWPFVQDLMNYEWFRSECLLYQAFEEQEHLDSAYFVPLKRLYEVKNES
ncbi:hypothetical protein SAMN05428975_3076 [Mucilaginibacter sp. OK268]|uniref:hypothetical protein n=1 Tax=Mucilaginibacter sp. OK268 TaxID=1881048 RepID=UPI00088C7D7B|nr:hypothetical protein [Mucilaginibacter sp. OK268]SDP85888.1 hypothetical protein SAMN05428975_3076 [Mucilaginibacter sp. OK268]